MRNLLEYPITKEEKVRALEMALATFEAAWREVPEAHRPIGDITGAALQAVLDDYTGKRKEGLQ